MQDGGSAGAGVQVSVVIPAYNAAADIAVAIASVQAQSLADFEIIVVDDASTDGTGAVVQALAAADPRIRYVRMATNGGPAASRNHGFAVARGTWIALLDADDRYRPERLAALVEAGAAERADIVSDNLLLCSPAGERRMIPEAKLSAARRLSFLEFIDGCHYDSTTPIRTSYVFMHPMFRSTFLDAHGLAYDPASRNGEDFLLYLDCLRAGAHWHLLPAPMYLYSVRIGSLTDIVAPADLHRMIDKLRSLMRDPEIRADRKLWQGIARHWRLIAGSFHYHRFKDAARRFDVRAMGASLMADRDSAGLTLRELGRRVPYSIWQRAVGRRTV